MSDCKKCKHYGNRCYCPPNMECKAFKMVHNKRVKHIFEFETNDDWIPGESACWTECPFSFNIRVGEMCRCVKHNARIECPFNRKPVYNILTRG